MYMFLQQNQLRSIVPSENGAYLGLFESSCMRFNHEINNETNVPTLTEMVTKAVEILSQNPKGFFLFVEGGRIDHALHTTKPFLALDETAEFARSVDRAVKMVNLDETLVVVTADHSHTMSFSGYPVGLFYPCTVPLARNISTIAS